MTNPKSRNFFSTRRRCILVCIVWLWAMPGLAAAELQRVEAVGIYGIRDSARSRVIPRDEAVAKARWEGISRVALELIGEAGTSQKSDEILNLTNASVDGTEIPTKNPVTSLRKALGRDVLPYMRSYRILEDRGEVPALFNDEPDVKVEYVVVVEVLVDVDRVTSALEKAGLITGPSQQSSEAVSVEVIGLTRFEALQHLLNVLKNDMGASRVRTLEFSRKRQVLLVEGPFGPARLSAKLARLESRRLLLKPTGVDSVGRRIRLAAQWFPEGEDPEFETSKPNF